jgi:hypothetical protein
MAYDSREYEWADITLAIGGRDITGIRAIKYSEKLEAEALFAKGRYAHSIQKGNIAYEGEIGVTQSEYEALVKAGKGSVLNLTGLSATCCYGNPANGDAMITDAITGIQITDTAKEWKQGDKSIDVTLKFLATKIQNQKA